MQDQVLQRLEENIQKMLLAGSFEKAKKIFSKQETLEFIKSYNSIDCKSYDETISQELELANEYLQIELKKKLTIPYEANLVELLISIAFLQSMDKIIELYLKFHQKFWENIKDSKFNDPKNLMFFQFHLGMVIAQTNALISPALQNLVKQYNLDEEEFSKQAIMLVSGDIMRFLEIDKYVDLKLFNQDQQNLSYEQVVQYIQQALYYYKEISENPLGYEPTIIISNLIYQFLYNEFKFTNQKLLVEINKYLDQDPMLQDLCLEYIYYQEIIRGQIINAIQYQQQMMQSIIQEQQQHPQQGQGEMPQIDEAQMQQMMEAMNQMDMEQVLQNMSPEMIEMMKQMYDPNHQG